MTSPAVCQRFFRFHQEARLAFAVQTRSAASRPLPPVTSTRVRGCTRCSQGLTARTTLNKRLHGVLTSKWHLIMKLSRNAKSKIKKNNAAHVQTPSSGHFLTATCAMTCAVANVSSQLPRESLLPDRWPWQLCEHPPVLPGAAQSCFCCDQRHLADVPMTTTPPYSH